MRNETSGGAQYKPNNLLMMKTQNIQKNIQVRICERLNAYIGHKISKKNEFLAETAIIAGIKRNEPFE